VDDDKWRRGARSTTRKMRNQWELMAPSLTDATRQEEEEEVKEEEKEAFQRLRERKGKGAGPAWLLSTINDGGYPRATCSGN
jgi:hypothetical protein